MAHIIQALMADIGSTLVDTPLDRKEEQHREKQKEKKKKEYIMEKNIVVKGCR